ncbi:uncharacterized protein FOMMEDRAFT_146417 [Fomitiporia mediterranea MF3/22]|uniref:uncharacterized protein n=1 Tax=Fomitiporia mediterranea (strain MF3/22) TaxID=694068 RepID=UPI0004409B1D|nr:uncharacterized protein FOMMEDRAFT_146417 [Fomitiporia mediterranea MF3/22]EJD04515.1 hypothetical protein FOMMEDRAFT_146417 [Fomitiporia mediterranea MF3/22]
MKTIRDLPVEILRKIFLYSLPARDEMLREEVKPIHSVRAPLYISHVCRHWREVALAFGDLWTHLCIDYVSCSKCWKREASQRARFIFTTWLDRTLGQPLNFTIHCELMDAEDDEHQVFEYIITELLEVQGRWQDVDFYWNGVEVASLRVISCDEMPALVSLSFDAHIIGRYRRLNYPYINVSGSKKLAFLDVQGVDLSFNEHLLESSDSEMEITEETLEKKLEEMPPVRTLDLPALKWLSYYGGKREDGKLIFTGFIRNSLPPLTVLDVTSAAAHPNTLVPALRLLPALEELRIQKWHVKTEFFQKLIPGTHDSHSPNSTICPSLRKLYLLNVNMPHYRIRWVDGVEEVEVDESEDGEDMEVVDETEQGEAMEIVVENRNENEVIDHGNESQDGPFDAEFVGAFCVMAEWRQKFLNTLGHIWVYDGGSWHHLLTEYGSFLCHDKIIAESFRGYLCVESAGIEPPHPSHLRRIATSLPN